MFLLYADESGDPGPAGAGKCFILTGLVIHESNWLSSFKLIKGLRDELRDKYEIRRNQELHANKNIAGRGALWGKRWSIQERIQFFETVLNAVVRMPQVRTINVCIDKKASYFKSKRGHEIYELAWKLMLQRFHNYIERRSQTGAECGMVIHDQGHDVEIRKLMRKLRVHNWVPSKIDDRPRNIPLVTLIDDPVPRDSFHAQFIQLCDYLAFALLRCEEPTPKYPGLERVFLTTLPIVLLDAAKKDPHGIVRFPKS